MRVRACRRAAIAVVVLIASGIAFTNAGAGEIEDPWAELEFVNMNISRTPQTATPFGDPSLGNGWDANDLFTNESQETIDIFSIEVMHFNPEYFDIDDIEAGNILDVFIAAEMAFGEDHWNNVAIRAFGGSNPDPVDWMSAELDCVANCGSFSSGVIPQPMPYVLDLTGSPITLAPGASFTLKTIAHNDIFGPNPLTNTTFQVGELVTLYRFNAVPEPGTAALLGLGLCALAARRRR